MELTCQGQDPPSVIPNNGTIDSFQHEIVMVGMNERKLRQESYIFNQWPHPDHDNNY